MQPDRRRIADPGSEGGARGIGRLVAPRPEPVVAAARRGLPFGLGWKPHAGPVAERLRLVTRDIGDGPVVMTVAVVLRVRHGHAPDPERVERDQAPRRLVLVRRVGGRRVLPHRERPGRDPHPVDHPGITGSTTLPPVARSTRNTACAPSAYADFPSGATAALFTPFGRGLNDVLIGPSFVKSARRSRENSRRATRAVPRGDPATAIVPLR